MVLWYCGTTVLWYCGTTVLWYCGTTVLWYYGTVVLRYCGTTHSPTNCAEKKPNYSTQSSAQTSTMAEANHGNLTQRSFQSPTIDHNATNTCEIGNSSRIASVNQSPFPKSNPETMVHQAPKSNKDYINTIAETVHRGVPR